MNSKQQPKIIRTFLVLFILTGLATLTGLIKIELLLILVLGGLMGVGIASREDEDEE